MTIESIFEDIKPPDNLSDEEFPSTLSKWKHTNGIVYEVMFLTNIGTLYPDKYPITVVYRGPNGKVWSRPLSDWHRSMTKL
jgi:hypothetical protein